MIRTAAVTNARLAAAWALTLTAFVLPCAADDSTGEPFPPIMLFQNGETKDATAAGGAKTAFAIMRLPDGGFAFYDRKAPTAEPISLPDENGHMFQLLPPLPPQVAESETILQSGVLDNTQVILTKEFDVLGATVRNEPLERKRAAEVGLPRYLNTWFQRVNSQSAFEPIMTWRGYNGSQMEYQQLASGRLLVPHGSFLPHLQPRPPFGRHETIIQYSDDLGETWRISDSRLVSPCYPGFNGSSEGACEPAIEELRDGRVWMLMRTAAGFLYESYSSDDGTTWSRARASRFNTSTGPPNIMRHSNGWLVVCWNNCELPPRHQGEGVYGGRDALHIAVSEDDGQTWRGFREIYLDHRRNDNPARSGDRGTAYPLGAYTSDGKIVVISGQGANGRNPILIDPEWIVTPKARTSLSDGLKQSSTYTHHGPAKRWWRGRAAGSKLIPHPTLPDRHCLHVRKQPNLPGDGATWNFPNGWKGVLTTRVMIREGFQGGLITLNDRFFDPANDLGEKFSVFGARVGKDLSLGRLKLKADTWADLRFEWDLEAKKCLLYLNEKLATRLEVQHPTLNGLSYIRFRSTADQTDEAGLLVEAVEVSIEDPFAPACSVTDQLVHEQRYTSQMVPLWNQSSE